MAMRTRAVSGQAGTARVALIIHLALLAIPAICSAETWLFLHRGASGFAFDGVERDQATRGLFERGSTETGLTWGGALTWDLGPRGAMGLGYERLLPDVDDLGLVSGLPLEAMDLEAEVFRAFAELRSPRSGGQEFGVGVGLGWLRTRGFLAVEPGQGDAAAPIVGELDGDDLVAEVYATLDAYLARRIALQVAGGYRRARIDNVEADGEPLVRADRSAVEFDYSGFFGRVGLKLGFYPLRRGPREADRPAADERAGTVMVEVGAAMLGALPARYFDDGEGAEGGYLGTAGWRGGRTAMGFGLRDEVWRDLTRRKVTVEDGRLFGYLAYHPYDLLTGPYLKIEAGAWEKLRPSDRGGGGELLPFLGLGSGYRVQLVAGLGLYAEGMTISRAGAGPSLEARVGTSLLLGG